MRGTERDEELAEAVRLRENGNAAEARLRLLALGEHWPDDARIAYQTAWAHDVLGREAEAVPHYERALRVTAPALPSVDRSEAFLGLGSTYRVLGRFHEAGTTLRRGVAEFPEHGALRAFLAMALYNEGRHQESVRLLLELLAATSEDPTVREYRGAIAEYARDLDGTVS
ncbi:tetratricopeptide repeat protein [Streptomyces sp. NBC_00690]|uniref:tetratricopeptide repeat protein n=1 Tax=Streptomyces sp. NBC_00690 TaxID=2975808 RepID=UPI002E2ABEF8|nr:tetratricopeptide repeat protein [Streptomyces sp. NBC_00690]